MTRPQLRTLNSNASTTLSSGSAPAPPGRRWAVPLIGATLLLVVAGLVVEIILLRNAGKRPESGTEGGPRETDRRAQDGDTDGKKERQGKDASPKKEDSVSEPRVERTRPEPARPLQGPPEPEERKASRPSEEVLTLLGGLISAHLYQSHLNICLLADGVAKKVYSPEDGKEHLETVGKLMDTVERQLAQLPEDTLQPDERKQLDRARRLLSLLRSQMKELRSYWDTGDDDYARKFQKIRKDVQQELDKLFDGPE